MESAEPMRILFWDAEALQVMPNKDEATALWSGKGADKLAFLDCLASLKGCCYVRALAYCCDLARLPQPVFEDMAKNFRNTLKQWPNGKDVLTEMTVIFLKHFGKMEWAVDEKIVGWIYQRFSSSKIKIRTAVEDGVSHLYELRGNPYCECEGPVCLHGFSFKMFSVMATGTRVGASGFNMMEFLSEGMSAEEGSDDAFEEVYSQLDPSTAKIENSERVVKGWKGKEVNPNPQPAVDKHSDELAALRHQIEMLSQKVQQPSPPTSPRPLFSKPATELTVGPNDSSSVYSRYGKRFMDQGTVMTMRPADNSGDQRDGRETLTVSNMLVNGFEMTEPVVIRQEQSLARLQPINGIPRPFSSARLNFLANLHTGIDRALQRRPGPVLEAMYRVMRSRPHLPCDELLYQVLTTTFDRASCTYSSNFFKLPYIEVGMPLTEDSVVKVFDLLNSEYKLLWFQELKNVKVPNFHKDYETVSRDVVGEPKVNRQRDHTDRVRRSSSRSGKTRSLLGF